MTVLPTSTVNEVLEYIQEHYDHVDEVQVYYVLRQYHVRKLRESGRELVRWCVAIERAGFTITSPLLSYVTGRSIGNLISTLHNLGDRHILILKRKPLARYKQRGHEATRFFQHVALEWQVHPAFLKYFNGVKEEVIDEEITV